MSARRCPVHAWCAVGGPGDHAAVGRHLGRTHELPAFDDDEFSGWHAWLVQDDVEGARVGVRIEGYFQPVEDGFASFEVDATQLYAVLCIVEDGGLERLQAIIREAAVS
jgi:hypothetical protein